MTRHTITIDHDLCARDIPLATFRARLTFDWPEHDYYPEARLVEVEHVAGPELDRAALQAWGIG